MVHWYVNYNIVYIVHRYLCTVNNTLMGVATVYSICQGNSASEGIAELLVSFGFKYFLFFFLIIA